MCPLFKYDNIPKNQSTSKIDGLPSRILFSALCYGLQMQMENQMHSGFILN